MLERRLRLWSGVAITLFVIPHLINHALGLISLSAMDSMRPFVMAVWQSLPGQVILYGALVIHFATALKSIYSRGTLRMPLWEVVQISLGLLVIPLLTIHVLGTRGAFQIGNVVSDYESVVGAIWSNNRYIWQQVLLILILWSHIAVGLHFWLRLKLWYTKLKALVFSLAILIPVLALLGFYRAGKQFETLAESPDEIERIFDEWIAAGDSVRATVLGLESPVIIAYGAILASVLIARWIKIQANRANRFNIRHPRGGTIDAPQGRSVLEALRDAGVPHASVCGGRGRCTTCRIRIGEGLEHLSEPKDLERAALQRIHADPNVRLACQTYPSEDIDVTPLLPPKASPEYAYRRGGVSGREQSVAAMFIDLRGSTGIGEQRLPYDVVFILNQFFSEMSIALEATDGHYAQFSGDGLMALYGLDSDLQTGCRNAIRGAIEMAKRMNDLNTRLSGELAAPLRIGIGIHCGEAIVGTMGPPKSPNFSAIGDNINIAARLEAKTKDLGCMLIISQEAASASGIDLSTHDTQKVDIRGREHPVTVYPVDDPASLSRI